MVRHTSGTVKQVGRACLKDYCGIDPQYILGLKNLGDELYPMTVHCNEFHPAQRQVVYDTVTVLAHAITAYKAFGYRKADEQESNKSIIMRAVIEHKAPVEADFEEAKKMAEDILSDESIRDYREFLYNVKVLLENHYCKIGSHAGFIAYAPVAYESFVKERERQAKHDAEMMQERMSSNYIGEIGKRISNSVSEMKLVTSWDTMYGTTYLYKMVDVNGNTVVWYASNPCDCDSFIGKNIKATVKDHDEYDGVKQTIVNRCKVV